MYSRVGRHLVQEGEVVVVERLACVYLGLDVQGPGQALGAHALQQGNDGSGVGVWGAVVHGRVLMESVESAGPGVWARSLRYTAISGRGICISGSPGPRLGAADTDPSDRLGRGRFQPGAQMKPGPRGDAGGPLQDQRDGDNRNPARRIRRLRDQHERNRLSAGGGRPLLRVRERRHHVEQQVHPSAGAVQLLLQHPEGRALDVAVEDPGRCALRGPGGGGGP